MESGEIHTITKESYLQTLERQMDWLENELLNHPMPLELMDVFKGLGKGLQQTWNGA